MSDLDNPNSPPIDLEDPTVTRLLVHQHDSTASRALVLRNGSLATSISVVVPVGGSAGESHLEGLEAWTAERIRVEVLVMETIDDAGRVGLRDRLTRSGRSWRVLERPPGGRAAALSAAAREAENEFVLVGTGGPTPFDLIVPALGCMWTDGGDAALLDTPPPTRGGPPVAVDNLADPAAQLAEWLGLSGSSVPGRLVVMRRWVARWLFNELTRAISPGEEVADRSRLLGIGIVRMSTPTVGPPAAGRARTS